ncbi:MAG: HDOD domain-containing protein [Pseudomonadales bacterium]
MAALQVNPVRVGTLRRLTAEHPYFAGWDAARLKAVEAYCRVLEAPGDATLLDLGALDPYAYFLVDGELKLEDAAGAARCLRAGELDAGFPIAHLRPSRYRVKARPGSRLLRIEGSQLKRYAGPARGSARFQVADASVGGSWQSHPLVTTLLRQMRDGNLEIPTMPGIALRIRRALAKENSDMAAVAAIVGADPGIAGRLIKVSNSSTFGGASPCETVQAALVRLGVQRAQSLVLVLATKDLFQAQAPHLRERMLKSWRHALDIAALAAVLARLTPGLDADRGLLVGLLHEIGALPILKLAAQFSDLAGTPLILDEVLATLTPEVSAAVLERWGMQETFRVAALNQGNWFREHEGGADYTDLLMVAHLHLLVRERAFHKLPRLDETPAFAKLALGSLSPQLSLQVLDEARAQIHELKALLS